MPRRTPKPEAFPPLYVLRAGESCSRCGKSTNVYALLASSLYDAVEDSTFNSLLVLKDIESLPKRVLALLEERCPGWCFDQQYPSELPCLMNHCLRCGARLTDYYLHAEPGSAFYPASADECWNIRIFALPVEDAIALACGWMVGGLPDLLDYDQVKPWEALPPVAT